MFFKITIHTVKYSLIVLFLFFYYTNFASNNIIPLNAKSAGMAGLSAMQKDIWANYSNQAGLAYLDFLTSGIHIENRYQVSQASTKALVLGLPLNSGTFGLNYSYYGYSKYNESKAGLAFGKKLGKRISAGIQLNYHNLYIAENYGSRNKLSFEGGIIAEPIDKFIISFHVFNPTTTKNDNHSIEHLPTIIKAGIAYTFQKNTFIGIETEKDLIENPVLKVGIEQFFLDHYFLRTGITTNPSEYAFGFGFCSKNFKIDLAYMFHQELGFSPHISLSYAFNKTN